MNRIQATPLSRKIRSGFFLLVGVYALFGIGMILSVLKMGRITPTVIRDNYTSISAVAGMRQAWHLLRHPEDHVVKDRAHWIREFVDSMGLEDTSLSEPGETEVASKIHELWTKVQSHLDTLPFDEFFLMERYLDELMDINQKAMYENSQNGLVIMYRTSFIAVGFLIATILLSLLLAQMMSRKIAAPIRKITEILHHHPGLETNLSLPMSTTLEVNILSHEMVRIWNNLSELKKLDVEELAKRESKLQTILSSVDDAIIVVDDKDQIVHCNPEMERILSSQAGTILGRKWENLESARDSRNYETLKEALKESRGMIDLEVESRSRTFDLQFRRISNNRIMVGAAIVLRDITEKKHQQRLKSEFIEVLSHELKTPLQSLSTAAELLKNKKDRLDGTGRLLVDTINEDAMRIRAVAQEFVQVSMDRLHSLTLKFEIVQLDELVQEWLKPFRVVAGDKGIIIDYANRLERVISVRIDKIKFPWALSNLLSNAIRVTSKGDTIWVELIHRGDHLVIRVADQGPGIPLASQGKIFEPYFQVPQGDRDISNGFLGIGLNIAKEVVNAHDGTIGFRANDPQGAVFEVSLPVLTL